MVYEDFNGLRQRKNKAKQSQFISVQRSAFSGQCKDEEWNMTKQACPEQRRMEPILGKNNKKKLKMSVNLEFIRVNSWLI